MQHDFIESPRMDIPYRQLKSELPFFNISSMLKQKESRSLC